ncbi:MAG TPA: VWA domain-containing protein [Phycisphaerales bacterium]|nr:VWA domain-containing protein [Phycisphaerales bacterium]
MLVRRALALVLLAGVTGLSQARACPPVSDPPGTSVSQPQPVVRIALLLDTSNSMDGLIGQAKSQLWNIVNRFDRSCKMGQKPKLQIALYQYGNDRLNPDSKWVQQVSGFTSDLDVLSEKLFGLQTDGGTELCGPAIGAALRDLDWNKQPADASFIFIAGNEPFDQAAYSEELADAVRKGVRINTIFCGTYAEGVNGKWLDGATLGRGKYHVIDQSEEVRHIPSPYDDEIAKLGAEVNTTYLAFGRDGEASKSRQARMDSAAESASPSAAVQRAVTKNTEQYDASNWDLVEAVTEQRVKLEDVKKEELPAEFRGLSVKELEAKINALRERRAAINVRVQELSKQRDAFVAQQQKQQTGATTLGDALVAMITQQAGEDGFTFE